MTRGHAELVALLKEQMGFLRSDAMAFDAGSLATAKRIAAVLRILLHDKGRQVALLSQLGVLESLRFLDTATPLDPGQLGWPALLQMRLTPDGPTFVPSLGRGDRRPDRPFQPWWNDPLDRLPDGRLFSRSDYVLGFAEREGGVHVDPAVDPLHKALDRDHAFAWKRLGSGRLVGENLAASCVRQIAHETDATVSSALAYLAG